MKWSKRDSSVTVEDVIERNTGLAIDDFLNPEPCFYIKDMDRAAHRILDAIRNLETITIYGDYDADGITSTSILYLMLTEGFSYEKVSVILPRRFSEGYGMSFAGIDRISEGLIITVDNGITAVEQVAYAKEKGLDVVIIDHHLPREDGQLPGADVIVDPNAIPGSDFSGYCGAGLAYKLAEYMDVKTELLEKLSGLATIGTVADVMELVKDNRSIVINGLANINAGKNVTGLNALLNALDMYEVTEGDIGFKLGPIINACGRLHDDGAMKVFQFLASTKKRTYYDAKKFIDINEERKNLVSECMDYCERIIAEDCLYSECPMLLYTTYEDSKHFHEGIVGILAGRIAEKYKVPVIVLTEIEGGILKGSGRSYGDVHLKNLLDSISDELIGYGGHAGAAGLSVSKEKVEDFRFALQTAYSQSEYSVDEKPDELHYDIEVNAHQIPQVMEKLKRFAPYGEGNPQIVFKVNNIRLVPRAGKFYRLMGAAGQHIKLFGQGFDVVGFDIASKYKEDGEPLIVDAVGTISENRFGTTTTLQVEMVDFAKRATDKPQSALAALLSKKLVEKKLK